MDSADQQGPHVIGYLAFGTGGGTGGSTSRVFDDRNKNNAVTATTTEEMSRKIVPTPTGTLSIRPVTHKAATPIMTPSTPVLTPDIPAIYLTRVLRHAIATIQTMIVTNSNSRKMYD